MIVHTALLLLAMSKLGVMLYVMGVPLLGAMMRVSMLQMLLLSVVPGLLRWMADQNRGVVDPLALHATWWMIGAIGVAVAIGWDRLRAELSGRHAGVLATILIIPAISLIVHVATAHWVHKTSWHGAHLAPLAMAGACALALRVRDPEHGLAKLQLMLPVCAVVLTWGAPQTLSIETLGTIVTPLRIVFAVSAVVYLIAAVRMWYAVPLAGSAVSTILTFAGHSPREIGRSAESTAQTTRQVLVRYWPSDGAPA
ncbi:MAG TPA: hypothetical protein PKB10_13860, partial [Tepidisphaeraceae bacterium]|nr:hypothetical protein [Tepidisphaeraceae bacterium]